MLAPQEDGQAAGTAPTPVAAYRRTPGDKAAITAHLDHQDKRPPARITVTQGEAGSVLRLDHPDPEIGSLRLMQALGSNSPDFANGLLNQVSNATGRGRRVSEEDTNFALSVINGIEPRDEVEAMLGAQMAAVHMATMTFARRLAHVENLQQQDSAERAFNKLARTFATQVEALKRYRSKGQQTVRVERVTVEAGGQAVVGAVSAPAAGGGGSR